MASNSGYLIVGDVRTTDDTTPSVKSLEDTTQEVLFYLWTLVFPRSILADEVLHINSKTQSGIILILCLISKSGENTRTGSGKLTLQGIKK